MDEEEKKAEFVSFCIESYKMMMGGVSGVKIADFFEEFGIIDYLLNNYDILHTYNKEEILDDIKNLLNEKGA